MGTLSAIKFKGFEVLGHLLLSRVGSWVFDAAVFTEFRGAIGVEGVEEES